MKTRSASNTTAVESPTMDAGKFFQSILDVNPFERNRITDPSQLDCDVQEIHAEGFQRILRTAAAAAGEDSQGRGLLLFGAAGSGKSHLLARLAQHCKQHGHCYVYLHNIQVEPNNLARYLLKCCVNHLAQDRLDRLNETALFRIVETAIVKAAKAKGIKKITNENREEVYQLLLQKLGGDPEIFAIVYKFYISSKALQMMKPEDLRRRDCARLASLAVRWLKGDVLDREEANMLGLSTRPGVESLELSEERIGAIWKTIALLAKSAECQFFLCLDQAENIDTELLKPLSRHLHALIDHVPNLLVIVSGVDLDLQECIQQKTITSAAADRLTATNPIVVNLLDSSQARQLLENRLEKITTQGNLPEQCKPFFVNDRLFPLGTSWFNQECANSTVIRPRDILSWAAQRWERIQADIRQRGGNEWLKQWEHEGREVEHIEPTSEEIQAGTETKIEEKLRESVAAVRIEKSSLPADAGNLLGLTKQLLDQCLRQKQGYTIESLALGGPNDNRLFVCENHQGQKIHTAVQFIATGSATSAAAKLRQLTELENYEHLLIVTDERMPLKLGAQGKNYWQQLEALGAHAFQHLQLSFDQYAELHAMLAVIGLARSRDLEIEPRPHLVLPIQEAQVLDTFHRRDLYRTHPLLNPLLSETEPPLLTKSCHGFCPAAFRDFVSGWLPHRIGGNLREILGEYLATHLPGRVGDACYEQAFKVAIQMNDEEFIVMTPWNNDVQIVIGNRA